MKKVLLLSLVFSTAAFAIELPSKKLCTTRESLASQTVDQTRDRFNVGEVTRTDVAQVELKYINIQLGCASIVRGTYCASAPEMAATFVRGVSEEAKAGQRTTLDLENALLEQADVTAICAD